MEVIGYILLGALLIPHPGIILDPNGKTCFSAGFQGNAQLASGKNEPNENMHAAFMDLRYGFSRDQNRVLFTVGYRYEIPLIAPTRGPDGKYEQFRGIRPKNFLSFYPSVGVTLSEHQFIYMGGLLKLAKPNLSYYIEFGKRYNLNLQDWADWSGLFGFSILM